MGDDWVHIIPEQPDLVPGKARREAAVLHFKALAPKADEVKAEVTEKLEFIHCGANFGDIFCPSCKAKVEPDVWDGWMNGDYQQETFVLNEHTMPCCGAKHTLHALTYEWPVGFARCNIVAMNPNLGKLSDEQRKRFEEILGCPVRVIYEHL